MPTMLMQEVLSLLVSKQKVRVLIQCGDGCVASDFHVGEFASCHSQTGKISSLLSLIGYYTFAFLHCNSKLMFSKGLITVIT